MKPLLRSETVEHLIPNGQSTSPAVKLRAEEQGQVLRNASLTHKKNIGSHLLNTYYVPGTFRFYI